jgi:hypothetical protein
MFFDSATQRAFGSLGWVDHGALWIWDAGSARELRIDVPDATYVRVESHGEGLFRLTSSGPETGASIRVCERPDVEIASLRPDKDGWRFRGDASKWGGCLAFLAASVSGGNELLLVDGLSETVRSLDLGWFNAETYDLGYQGLADCIAMPESGVVVVSVQRSSELVLIDIDSGSKVRTMSLAGRRGNPNLCKLTGIALAASDYDVLCLVDIQRGTVTASEVLQSAASPNTAQFVGDYTFANGAVAVARPFSGDVIRLDPVTLAILDRTPVGGQPLSVCMVSDDAFVTRDWKTGTVRTGSFTG